MRLGGVDVSTVDGEALLKNYAIVFQDVLFADTVMEKHPLSKRTPPTRRCWRRRAAVRRLVSGLPEGLPIPVGGNRSPALSAASGSASPLPAPS